MIARAKPAVRKLGAIQLPPVREHTTAEGLAILVARREPIPLISVRLTLDAGAAADPAGKFGLADFVARLLRRGAGKLSAEQIDDQVEFVGASLNAGAGEDYSAVTLTTPERHLPAMIELLATLVREPTFLEEEVESARRRVLAQLANELDDPSLVADRAATWALWGRHPYGHDVTGITAHVKSFTRADLQGFHRQWYGPRVGLLAIVGAVDEDRALSLVERAFGGWNTGAPMRPAFEAPKRAHGAGRVLLVDKPDQSQSQVRLGGMALRRGHPDWIPAAVMNTCLGGGFTSRLVNEIRVNRGLSYGASSHFEGLRAAGVFAVTTFTKTESTREIIDVALGELAKMRARGPTPRELETARTYISGLYPLRLETNESVAAALSEIRLYGLGPGWIEGYRERILAVTRARAAEVARRLLPAEDPAIVVVGNASKARKLLKGLGPIEVRPTTDFA